MYLNKFELNEILKLILNFNILMERCYFNSCILNDNKYLSKYKKHFINKEGKLTKELFKDVEKDNKIIKSLNIISDLKKYKFCMEHYNNLVKLSEIKEKILSKPDNIPKDCLISLNKILKNDIDLKKRLYEFENTNIIKILLKNLYSSNDKDIKLYLLLNLNHFLKEYIVILKDKNINDEEKNKIEDERHLDNEIFGILVKEIKDLKLEIYNLNQKKVNPSINDENLLRDVILYNLCLNNIECLFNNWNKKKDILDLKKTTDLIQNTSDILCQVISAYDSIPNKIICNELFYNIIGFLNVYLLCEIKNFDLVVYLINFFVKTNQHIYGYLEEYKNEKYFKNTIRNFMTILNTVLETMIGVSLRELQKEQMDNFLDNSEKFNQDKKYELLFYKNNDLIKELKEKVRLTFLNNNNLKINNDKEN